MTDLEIELVGAPSIETPLVSVLVNCFNSERYLRQALDSVVAQTYQRWELVFWDNRSTDASAATVQSYDDPRIRYFLAPVHTSLGEARSLAVEQVRGQFIAILDCDDLWYPEKLERQMALAAEMPTAGVLYSGYDIISSTGVKRAESFRRAVARSGDVFPELLRQDFTVCWPTVVFRTEALEEAGTFAPMRYVEDLEILLRVASRRPFAYTKERLAAYRVHDSQLSTNYLAMRDEVLAICDAWEARWRQHGALSSDQRTLLARARARAWSVSAKNAMMSGVPALAMYGRALQYAASAEAVFGFAASLFGPRVAAILTARVRTTLGYGNL
jgi:glycosyltransferase involved in cell wall biosynthesis